jgi:hypothetical protein
MGLALTPFESSDGFSAVRESQRVSLAENAQGIRHEQYSHQGRRQHHSEMRRNRRCCWRSKSVTSFTLMSRSNAPGPSPFASQFRVVMCARPQRELLHPRALSFFPPAGELYLRAQPRSAHSSHKSVQFVTKYLRVGLRHANVASTRFGCNNPQQLGCHYVTWKVNTFPCPGMQVRDWAQRTEFSYGIPDIIITVRPRKAGLP